MSFTIYYQSVAPVTDEQRSAIGAAANLLCCGRTWLSCEPVHFLPANSSGLLMGCSKPHFLPDPEAALSVENVPDGTLDDVINVLCQLSREHAVDWQLSHDEDPEWIGLIHDGNADAGLLARIEALAEIGDLTAHSALRTSDTNIHPVVARDSASEDQATIVDLSLSDDEIIKDVEFVNDIKGPALIVHWRSVPLGFIRPLTGNRDFDEATRKAHKEEWYDSFWCAGFHKTRELAACEMVRRKLVEAPLSEAMLAAVREDYEFIAQWKQRLIDSIEIDEDE